MTWMKTTIPRYDAAAMQKAQKVFGDLQFALAAAGHSPPPELALFAADKDETTELLISPYAAEFVVALPGEWVECEKPASGPLSLLNGDVRAPEMLGVKLGR